MKLFTVTEFQRAQITDVKHTKKKHDTENKVASTHIDIVIDSVPADVVGHLVGVERPALDHVFFADDSEIIWANVGWLDLECQFADRFQIHINREQDRVFNLHKFKIKPSGGETFKVRCTAHVKQPNKNFRDQAIDFHLEDTAPLKLEPLQDLFDKAAAEG